MGAPSAASKVDTPYYMVVYVSYFFGSNKANDQTMARFRCPQKKKYECSFLWCLVSYLLSPLRNPWVFAHLLAPLPCWPIITTMINFHPKCVRDRRKLRCLGSIAMAKASVYRHYKITIPFTCSATFGQGLATLTQPRPSLNPTQTQP